MIFLIHGLYIFHSFYVHQILNNEIEITNVSKQYYHIEENVPAQLCKRIHDAFSKSFLMFFK